MRMLWDFVGSHLFCTDPAVLLGFFYLGGGYVASQYGSLGIFSRRTYGNSMCTCVFSLTNYMTLEDILHAEFSKFSRLHPCCVPH